MARNLIIMSNKWLRLHISAKNQSEYEILNSFLIQDSMGSIIKKNSSIIFFQLGFEKQIESRINKLKNRFDFDWNFSIEQKRDWSQNWKKYFKPKIIEEKLIILPSWDDSVYDYPMQIKIHPGMAFGTGHHESTELIIKMMLNNIKKSHKVLDVGAGSGILSILTSLLSTKKIDALEFDSSSEDNFRKNIKLNQSKNITLYDVDCLKWSDFNYDIILANINKKVIIKLINTIKNCSGKILFSGLLNQDFDIINFNLIENKFRIINKLSKNEWMSLVVEKV